MVSASVGTTIEWYDFFLYGVAAAAVFPQKFFPSSDPFIATMLSFTTFFVGFVARPVGAAIFGHFGDRVGRKKLLVFTMIVMGASTMAVGLTPGYDVIGIWGAVFLTIGRVLQGLAIGGQWSGSVLMAAEWTDPKRRGFTTSFAQLGAPGGMVLANGALALMTGLTSDQAFLDWGWRVPFLASVALVITGFYIRSGVKETPVFEELKKTGAIVKAPIAQVLRHHGKEVVLATLLRTSQQVCFYIYTTYVITYATTVLGLRPRAGAEHGDGDGSGVVLRQPAVRTSVGSVRPPHDHRDRLRADDRLPVHLLPAARHALAAAGLPGDPAVEPDPGPPVRTAGGLHRRELSRVGALQRLVARLSAGVDHRGRPGADRRDAAAQAVRHLDRRSRGTSRSAR